MKKNKVILTRTGEEYTCKYLLDAADVVDTKVDMGMLYIRSVNGCR